MDYLAYHFQVHPPMPGSEILMASIVDMGFDSFENTGEGFVAYIAADQNNKVDLSDLVFEDFRYSFRIEEIKAANWNQEWETNFDPVVVDDLLCIRAPFHVPNNTCREEIVIMPKMSFGTGHHQTTRLMCRAMFGLKLAGTNVLDMGCGTGILAILAMKLGAKDVTGIDIDPWCVENAVENCVANGCAKIKVQLGGAEVLQTIKGVDIVLANINRNILKAQMKEYARVLKPGGSLLVSGFFVTDAEELTNAASESGFETVSSDNENEWCMLGFRKL